MCYCTQNTLPSLKVDLEKPPPRPYQLPYLGPKSLKTLALKPFYLVALEKRGRFIYSN
jgi:hypothetical protein